MEIEFEVAWAADYFKQFAPIPGDLVTVHGRPVVDCAHCPFKAEIHPADMIVASRSFVMAPDQFTPLVDDTRVTDAYIWGNAFLPQQLQIVGPVYAPPRISIDAQLVVQHQENGYSKQTNMQATTQFITGGMQVTMTGPSPGVVVTSDGEWMFPTSNVGEFVDNWQLSWQE